MSKKVLINIMNPGKAPADNGRTITALKLAANYGPAFDAILPDLETCNMCCIRFDAMPAAQAAGVPVHGEGREHWDMAGLVLDDWQILNF